MENCCFKFCLCKHLVLNNLPDNKMLHCTINLCKHLLYRLIDCTLVHHWNWTEFPDTILNQYKIQYKFVNFLQKLLKGVIYSRHIVTILYFIMYGIGKWAKDIVANETQYSNYETDYLHNNANLWCWDFYTKAVSYKLIFLYRIGL